MGGWGGGASSLLWWVRKAGVFGDESRKRGLSARGQGGSVAGDADNLSQRRPLAALCPNLCGKWGETGRYLPPPLLLLLLGTHLLSHSVLPTLCALWSGTGILFSSPVFWCYFPFVYISSCAACETSEQRRVLMTFRRVCLLFCSFVQAKVLPLLLLAPDEFENVPLLKSINLSLPGPSSSSFYCDEGCTGRTFAAGKVIWITS